LSALEDDPHCEFDQERILRSLFGDVIYLSIPKLPAKVLEGCTRTELAYHWATTLPMVEITRTLTDSTRPNR